MDLFVRAVVLCKICKVCKVFVLESGTVWPFGSDLSAMGFVFPALHLIGYAWFIVINTQLESFWRTTRHYAPGRAKTNLALSYAQIEHTKVLETLFCIHFSQNICWKANGNAVFFAQRDSKWNPQLVKILVKISFYMECRFFFLNSSLSVVNIAFCTGQNRSGHSFCCRHSMIYFKRKKMRFLSQFIIKIIDFINHKFTNSVP